MASYKVRQLATTKKMIDEDVLLQPLALDYYRIPSQIGHGTVLSMALVRRNNDDETFEIDPHADAGAENQALIGAALLMMRFVIDLARAKGLGHKYGNLAVPKAVLSDAALRLKLYLPVSVKDFMS